MKSQERLTSLPIRECLNWGQDVDPPDMVRLPFSIKDRAGQPASQPAIREVQVVNDPSMALCDVTTRCTRCTVAKPILIGVTNAWRKTRL